MLTLSVHLTGDSQMTEKYFLARVYELQDAAFALFLPTPAASLPQRAALQIFK